MFAVFRLDGESMMLINMVLNVCVHTATSLNSPVIS